MNRNWYTVEEASKVLGISKHTLRTKIATNEIKANKVGREWRLLKSEIDSVLGIETRSDEKDAYIKELEEKIKYLTFQVETFKSVAGSLIKVIS